MSTSVARDEEPTSVRSTTTASTLSPSTAAVASPPLPTNHISPSKPSLDTSSATRVSGGNDNGMSRGNSDRSSPMPLVGLRAIPSGSMSLSQATTTTTTTSTRAPSLAPPSQSGGTHVATTSAGLATKAGNNRRHLYPSQSLSSNYAGTFSPVQLPPPYHGSDTGRGTTTSSSSYNHPQLSPGSSPSLHDHAWVGPRGLKRHLPLVYDHMNNRTNGNGPNTHVLEHRPLVSNATSSSGTQSTVRRGPSSLSSSRSTPLLDSTYVKTSKEDPRQYEPIGEARYPRDSTRYETWTSKQLRKKCSHLKLRGLKNVKKHVMVEALYRYNRNQRMREMADAGTTDTMIHVAQPPPLTQPRREVRRPSVGPNTVATIRQVGSYPTRFDPRHTEVVGSPYDTYASRSYTKYGSQSPSPPSSGNDSGGLYAVKGVASHGYSRDDDVKSDVPYKEVPVTSEDVIRLVDVVLSPEFVDRLAAELSRWQFWVDVREMYIALLNRQHPTGFNPTSGKGGLVASTSATNSRNFKWSSMQLWEIWKELSFAYTKTCFEFTAAGVEDREYINFCDGRPDVYYLHQRLHLRPDLLHLIKSNEYIDEKCTSEASESIAHDRQQKAQQQTGPLIGSSSPMLHTLKRYKRSAPLVGTGSTSSGAYDSARAIAAFRQDAGNGSNGAMDGTCGVVAGANARRREARGPSPEENSTENSETTGEEGSSNTANSNASNSSHDVSMRAALAEQKYFGLLLQNFEVIFESLHNKKVLLATLRKDSKAPDQLIADLHDDIHVLSALKKDFRMKLRRTIHSLDSILLLDLASDVDH
ncbi:hypothetical protein CCR75_000860 [Bremia lactucae]|uniref:Uncharacterized protein n=1 Tax=Bremia lactucae TaxID=4779 RepID=A0A976FN99_BRELC|nr:hypothetical protein CCR75_000860 [Bremia lactucae]